MARTQTHRLVESHPCLTVGEVTKAGGFQTSRTRTVVGRHFEVRRLGQALRIGFDGLHERRTIKVALRERRLPRGSSFYFLCPISGRPSLKLFIADGRLGCAKALGLVHLSRARPRDYKLRNAKLDEVEAHPLGEHHVSTEDGWQGPLDADYEAILIQAMVTWFQRGRAGTLPSTRCRDIWDWGFAHMHPQLDANELVRLGLVEEGRRHVSAFEWTTRMGIDHLLVATDLSRGQTPMMVLEIVSRDEVVHQAVTLVRQGEHWLFRCPVTGHLTAKLYGNAGRFGSPAAQYVVQGRDLPEREDTDTPIVAANWTPDEGPSA